MGTAKAKSDASEALKQLTYLAWEWKGTPDHRIRSETGRPRPRCRLDA